MAYEELKKIYYADSAGYEAAYQARFAAPNACHIDFLIGKYPAFFVLTPELTRRMLAIQRADKAVLRLCQALPDAAINQFSRRCLIDEILLTNDIEGVSSTRREISETLSSLEKEDRRGRFHGLAQKYELLRHKASLSLKTCQDVRQIYDELVLDEVRRDDPDNAPDGEIFRRGAVSVRAATQKVIHQGVYPEAAIIAAMEKALAYLNDESEELLLRTAVFHYLLGYIHPFYDGNGRLNRFISSYMLSKELEPVLGYRLSYTIKENIAAYYRAFRVGNHPLNRGDLTPFVSMFLSLVESAVVKLGEALAERHGRLARCEAAIDRLPHADDALFRRLYSLLAQAALFSEHGAATQELLSRLAISRGTLRAKLAAIDAQGLLTVELVKSEKFCCLNLSALHDETTKGKPLK